MKKPFPWGQSRLLAQQTVQHRDHLGAGAGACGISRLSEPLRMAAFAAHAMASSAYADHLLKIVKSPRVRAALYCFHTQRPGKAVEHDRHLLTGDGITGAETAVAVAGDDAKGRRPADSLRIVGVGSHIGKERRLLRLGLSGRPPQEGHQLAAGAVRIRREMRVVRSEGDPLAYGPEDRFIVIIVRRHVREGDRHVGRVQKGRFDQSLRNPA